MKVNRILPLFVVILLILVLVVFFLNPIEAVKQARDNQRVSDLENLKKAIDLYITKNATEIKDSPNLLCTKCQGAEKLFAFRDFSIGGQEVSATPYTYVNGEGWIPLDLSLKMKIDETPIRELPVDPLEKSFTVRTKFPLISGFYDQPESFTYTFTTGRAGKYKLTAKMESKLGLDKASDDGGNLEDRLEVGSDLELAP